jgi:hypothetical protein
VQQLLTVFRLDNNSNWNSKIASVHLIGAAINNQLIAKNTPFGNAIENVEILQFIQS